MTRKKWESDLNEELEFHLKMLEQENIRAGMNPDEARRNAILKLGGTQQIKELSREQRFGFALETFWRDVVYGIRMLRKSLTLTVISIATLVLAIAACTALFSVLNGVVLRPLPYPHPEQLVEITDTNPSKGIARIEVNGLNLEDWRKRSHSFEGIAAYYTMGRTLSANNESEVVLASQVSSDFFRILKTRPLFGRLFTEQESQAALYNQALGLISPNPVAILSHGLWKRRFGGDPNIVGKTIILDRKIWKVVGVMPRDFAMPDAHTALWIPWGLLYDFPRDQHFAGAIARTAPGITLSDAEGELNSIADQLGKEFPETNEGWKVRFTSLQAAITGDFKQILWFLFFAVGLVVLIACVNIAIVQLSGASARIQETSVRIALGASRSRVIQQHFVESSLIALCGGMLGFASAYFAIHALQRIAPDLPRVAEITIDWNVLFLSAAITCFSALLFGLAPAFFATSGIKSAFSNEGARSTSRMSTQRIRNILVITEVALAVILLSSSGMLIRSFLRLGSTDFGFQPRNVLVVPVFLDTEKYNSGAKSRAYYKELIERLQNLPDVISVGGATALPASPMGPDFQRPVWEQGNVPQAQNRKEADVRMVTTDYFKTLGISVVRGRRFTAEDGPDSTKVVMISDSLVREIWGKRDPIGKQLVVDYSTAGTYPYEIIGVVHDIRFHGPRSVPRPEIYFPHAQKPYLVLNIAIHTKTDPRLLIGSVRNILLAIDPQKPAHNITTLQDLIGATMIRDRYAMILVSCFAFVSLMLAALGIYGVLSFFVRQRVPEIGIRMALGARQKQIIAWIRNQGAQLMLAGLVIGLIGTLSFSHLLSGILYQVSPRDFISLIAAVAVIVCTAVTSAWIPARRASRIDPGKALRSL